MSRALLNILLFVVIAFTAFLLLQIAYSHGRVSVVVPVAGITGTLLTLLLAAVLLREPLSQGRVLGVGVMLLGLSLALRSPSAARPS